MTSPLSDLQRRERQLRERADEMVADFMRNNGHLFADATEEFWAKDFLNQKAHSLAQREAAGRLLEALSMTKEELGEVRGQIRSRKELVNG